MKTQSQSHVEQEWRGMARRNFIWQGSAGLLGLTLCPSQTVLAAPAWQGNLFLKFVGRFAENVGFNLISSYIYDHIKEYLNREQGAYVAPKIREKEDKGLFTSPDWSKVYGPWQPQPPVFTRPIPFPQPTPTPTPTPAPYFFTPLLKRDGTNGAAQFFDLRQPQRQQYWAGTLAAPSLVGLGKAAPEMLQRRIVTSREALQAALLPISGGQYAMSCGCFENSYDAPDSYYSALGRVQLDYERTSRNSGVVNIKVYDRNGRQRFAAEYCTCPEMY
ncbi:MAG: hypothetical protein HYR56_16795 [Acidobacteria bacterium]|nr:hypothetical protein [Acidobacteriota bacterium]MBI3428043.1 hypothetical protein [Acidobacteriota bacterium]